MRIDNTKPPSGQTNLRRIMRIMCVVMIITACLWIGIVYLARGMANAADYQVILPSGYVLYRTNASTIFIAMPGKQPFPVIAPNIEKIGIVSEQKLIIGYASPSPSSSLGPSRGGYFILDTAKRSYSTELDDKAWRSQLQSEYGVTAPMLERLSDFRGRDHHW